MLDSRLIVSFKTPARAAHRPQDTPYLEEVERFAAADPRWRDALAIYSARLSPAGRCTLGVVLSGLEAGPAPRLMSFSFCPDDEEESAREARHMQPVVIAALGLLVPTRIGLSALEVAEIRGIVTAVHRQLRSAKTRP